MEMRVQVWRYARSLEATVAGRARSSEAAQASQHQSAVQGQPYLQRLEIPAISASLFPAQTKLGGLSMPLWIGWPSAGIAKLLRLMSKMD